MTKTPAPELSPEERAEVDRFGIHDDELQANRTIERAAKAMFEDPMSAGEYSWDQMVAADPERAQIWRDDAVRVLNAARVPAVPAPIGDDLEKAARAVYAAQYPDAAEMFDDPELKRERNGARRLAAAALSAVRFPVVSAPCCAEDNPHVAVNNITVGLAPGVDHYVAVDEKGKVVSAPMEATFTAEEVIGIANDTSDLQGNLYRLDFISLIEHEASRVLPVTPAPELSPEERAEVDRFGIHDDTKAGVA